MMQKGRYTMFLNWKNQHCQNDYTSKGNLQIQCNLFQTTNGICHRTRRKNIKAYVPGSAVVKGLPGNAGDAGDSGSISGSGRSPGGGNGHPLQCSCLGNPTDREAWQIRHSWGTEHTLSHGNTKDPKWPNHFWEKNGAGGIRLLNFRF